MKSVLLIGLGNFGMMIAKQIHELGHQVMAVDIDEERVNEALPYATNALIGDSTNANFLASLGVNNFDVLIRNKIALWDVIQSCDIVGSSDSSITNVVPNDLSLILNIADIKAIYVNGKTALKYYEKYTEPVIKRPAICLPSTSPANAAWNMEKLLSEWKCINE